MTDLTLREHLESLGLKLIKTENTPRNVGRTPENTLLLTVDVTRRRD